MNILAKRLWQWLQLRSKAKPVVVPWPVERDKVLQVDEYWEVQSAHMQEVRRVNYVTRAFFAMCAGPILGDVLVDLGLSLAGVVLGGAVTLGAGLVSAYYRGN